MKAHIAPESIDFLRFQVGPYALGVEAAQVKRLCRLASPGDAAKGSAGQLPEEMIDLGEVCGLRHGPEKPKTVLVVQREGAEVGYVVDGVAEVTELSRAENIRPLPPLVQQLKGWPQLWGVATIGTDLVFLVDLI